MQKKEVENFQRIVWDFYRKNKRDLPWRPKRGSVVSPYEILVSEFMLQQTQVDRVIPKYLSFIKTFPTIESLAAAEVRDVLALWSGLGYNRRALYLKKTAETIVSAYKGLIPKDPTVLRLLPGVGAYMSAVLPVFIFNQKEYLIETNIRTVLLYHFFENKKNVHDKEILRILSVVTPDTKIRDWYYALMDYGTYLKKNKKIKNTQSAGYKKQKPFVGSLRYVRGGILKHVLKGRIQKNSVYELFPKYIPAQVDQVCNDLIAEGLLHTRDGYLYM